MRTRVPFARPFDRDTRAIPARLDALLAAILGVGVGSVAAAAVQESLRPLDGWAYLLVAAAAGALAWRRVAPLAALAGAVAAVGVYLLGGYPYGPIQLCMVLAMFEVARRQPLPTSLLACGVAATAAVVAILPRLAQGTTHQPIILVIAWTGWLVVPWALGALAHVRADAAVRLRRDLIARVALEERMWIAREVHDVAGHGLSAIAMQAGVALLVLDERPDQARASLEAIRATSTQALDELRVALGAFPPLGVTRPADSPLLTDLTPTPDDRGLHDLGALVDRVGAAGLPVDLELAGADTALPREIAAAAYRIVQEALTNVLRHAGPTRALVRVTREADTVVVEVADRGRGLADRTRPAGHGLAGMRARVEATGGSFAAGPRDGGGFRVVARLPLPGAVT